MLLHYHNSHRLVLESANIAYLKEQVVRKLTELPVADMTLPIEDSELEYLADWYHPDIFAQMLSLWNLYYQLTPPERALLLTPLLAASNSWSWNDLQRQKLCRSRRAEEKVLVRIANPDWPNALKRQIISRLEDVAERYCDHKLESPWPYTPDLVLVGEQDGEHAPVGRGDVVVTSPPYLRAQEYIRASKLSLLWLNHPLTEIRQQGRLEIPYCKILESQEIRSPLYQHISQFYERRNGAESVNVLQSYFSNVINTLERASSQASKLYLFVGSANLKGNPVPLDTIFMEHLTLAGGWSHVETLRDRIVAKTLFATPINPATGVPDLRMDTEQLVVLAR